MSEREDLICEIDERRARKEFFVREALLVAQGYLALGRISSKEADRQLDGLDELHDREDAEIGRLHARLWEIEARESRKVMLWDAAYGRSL